MLPGTSIFNCFKLFTDVLPNNRIAHFQTVFFIKRFSELENCWPPF